MYIPKGQILDTYYYTGGNEYQTPNRNIYIGYYHKDTSDRIWSGKEHNSGSIQLINIIPSSIEDNNSSTQAQTLYYNKLTKTPNLLGANAKPVPSHNFTPTLENYTIGYLPRYFVKYNAASKPKFIETNQATFKNIVTNPTQYHSIMLTLVSLLWRIKGPVHDQYKNNILVKPGVYDSNQRSLKEAEKTCPGISLFLPNLLEGAIIES
jgi:hypothetical protein